MTCCGSTETHHNYIVIAIKKKKSPTLHHSSMCLGPRFQYIPYLTMSALILQPRPNVYVCVYHSHNTMMTLSGRLRGLKGNTTVAVCAVDLSSYMRAICFNSRYTRNTARPANRKPHNHKHLPSRFCCYRLTLCHTSLQQKVNSL